MVPFLVLGGSRNRFSLVLDHPRGAHRLKNGKQKKKNVTMDPIGFRVATLRKWFCLVLDQIPAYKFKIESKKRGIEYRDPIGVPFSLGRSEESIISTTCSSPSSA